MRHPLHAICPYFAMFPESFVAEQLLAYSQPNDLVFDPFCGRGTTVLESLLHGRDVIGSDVNLVAACVAGAKADVPERQSIINRLHALEVAYSEFSDPAVAETEFFAACFHPKTYSQVHFLRSQLEWRTDATDRFIAAVVLGVLHGESHRSAMCLSNRMPRTISTKPEYSVRWWASRDLKAPERDAFAVLRQAVAFRFSQHPPSRKGRVLLTDARNAGTAFGDCVGKVALIVTSPPYIDTTDYAEDQWLRLWFLGEGQRPEPRKNADDRHTSIANYWRFLDEVWAGSLSLLRDHATIVIRIGGTRIPKEDLHEGLLSGLQRAAPERSIKPLHSGKSSVIAKRQTNSFRPGTSSDRLEHDFTFTVSRSQETAMQAEAAISLA